VAVQVTEPQQARSVASRKRLLDATITCLAELGFARTSTTAIAAQADMSQGALFKHFPNKALLMGAATRHLFDGLIAGYRRGFVALGSGDFDVEARLDAALDLLWLVFTDKPLQAAFELYVAARTDDELAAVLRPILRDHSSKLRAEGAALFPELAGTATFNTLIAGIMSLMQGAALTAPIDSDSREELEFLRRVVRRDVAAALKENS
jgi:AcrR family transcriptional regulator